MKNKSKTYVLLALVLGIWGIVGYKIVSVANPVFPEMEQLNFEASFNPKTNTEVDTFSIKTANRDPFLGTLLVKKSTNKKPKTSKKAEVIWLPVIYHGLISKQNGKTKVFIISIEGEQYIMKLGQVINGVKLMRGKAETVVVSYKKTRKTIQKS